MALPKRILKTCYMKEVVRRTCVGRLKKKKRNLRPSLASIVIVKTDMLEWISLPRNSIGQDLHQVLVDSKTRTLRHNSKLAHSREVQIAR